VLDALTPERNYPDAPIGNPLDSLAVPPVTDVRTRKHLTLA
jgi:hypothetical protein